MSKEDNTHPTTSKCPNVMQNKNNFRHLKDHLRRGEYHWRFFEQDTLARTRQLMK